MMNTLLEKEALKKHIEAMLVLLGIYTEKTKPAEAKRFADLSSNPTAEIKQHFTKFNDSYNEALLDEAIAELLPSLYVK